MTEEQINHLQSLLEALPKGKWDFLMAISPQVCIEGKDSNLTSEHLRCINDIHNLAPALLEAARENLRLREALEECDRVFTIMRSFRRSDGALKSAVEAVNKALSKEVV